ncbi:MAG: sugar kinase [Euryarchaeota archaeon]|nr:sugar kinase [Euryarchaeota archaeon]|tara:strand:+ start:1292 stop:2266 length:975 start_codon:yes stop_codon:yes gene_type:complete
MEIVIVGSLAYDNLETDAGSVNDSLGGSGTFAGLAAAFHTSRRQDPGGTLPVGLVCAIGEDFKDSDFQLLQDAGLNLDGIERIEGGRTFRWHGKYEGDMAQAITIETQQNVLDGYHPKVPAAWWAPRVLFLANNHPSIQSHVLDQCEGAKFTALDSMNLWINIAFEELSGVLRRIDLAILNDNEVRMIAKDENLIRAGESIRSGIALAGGKDAGSGPAILIIKKGEHGCVALTDNGILTLPAFPTSEIIDPTGCGDSFAGTLLTFLSETEELIPSLDELHNALVHATVMASFTLSEFGVKGIVELERGEYHARLDTYRRMVGLL